MIRLMLLMLVSSSAFAQYQGPAVESCRAFALRELKRQGGQPQDVVFDRDAALVIERYTRKVGNQFVSSVLTGNGAIVLSDAPSAELSFVCLLADENRAVFFSWLSRPSVSALAQCTRDATTRAKTQPCLETLLRSAEDELTQLYAQRFQEANARGEAPLAAYRKSNDEWRQYRDAECKRRRDTGESGEPAERELACMVELTRRRGQDMR